MIPINSPQPLSRRWTARDIHIAAVRNIPQEAVTGLYAGEWLSILNRAIHDAMMPVYSIFANNYMSRAVVSVSDGEVDLSTLDIAFAGNERRLKVQAINAKLIDIYAYSTPNEFGTHEVPVVAGDNVITLPHNPLGDWIFDNITVVDSNGSPTYFTVKSVFGDRFTINVPSSGILKYSYGTTGYRSAGAVLANPDAKIQDIKVRIKQSLTAGRNVVNFPSGVSFYGSYSLNNFISTNAGGSVVGVDVKDRFPTYMIVDAVAATTLETEIVGMGIFPSTISTPIEQRIKTRVTGSDIVTIFYPITFGATPYSVLSIYAFDDSGNALGWEIQTRTANSITLKLASIPAWVHLRVGSEGLSYKLLPKLANSDIVFIAAASYEDFMQFNPTSQHARDIGMFWYGEGKRLFIKSGSDVSNISTLIVHYPRIPYKVSLESDYVDVPDGEAIELVILTHRLKLAERFGIQALAQVLEQKISQQTAKVLGAVKSVVGMTPDRKQAERILQ